MFRVFLALLLTTLSAPAFAWGEYGHRLVARIAAAELTPAARREVRRILARSAAADTPACPLATIEDASVWPDCVRGLGDRFKPTFEWHYQDIQVCGDFDIAQACPDGNCVTAQIPKQLAIAADRRAAPGERAKALAFVIHFTGDMHQPLHIGERHDKGGNDVLAAYGYKAPPKMNLHRIWDSELAERALTEPPVVGALSPTRAERREWAKGGIADWAHESWLISRDVTYGKLRDDHGSCAVNSKDRVTVDEAYIAASRDAVRTQVQKAGVRLAVLLNGALGHRTHP